VEALSDALTACGLRVWLDKSEIADFQSITRSIQEGLANAKALLAWYSAEYLRSRACQWELNAAFIAAQHDGDPRRRVLVVNPEQGNGHIHPVELRDEEFLAAQGDVDFARIAERIAQHLSGISGVLGQVRAVAPPQWYPVQRYGSERFVGRLAELSAIHSGLWASAMPVITHISAPGLVQLIGMGGSGKSLVAEEYALRFGNAYPGGVFWLNAGGPEPVEEIQLEVLREVQFRNLASSLRIDTTDRSAAEVEGELRAYFGRSEMPFLWVVDDVPHSMPVSILRRWMSPHPRGRTLLTARSTEYAGQGVQVSVGGLLAEEGLALLTRTRAPSDPNEEVLAKRLVDELGRHALALDVASARLDWCSFAELMGELSDTAQDALSLAAEFVGQLPNGHEASIANTLLQSIRHLDNRSLDFLRLASILAPEPIPLQLVRAALTARAQHRGELLRPVDLDLSLHNTVGASLAQRTSDGITVHVLVARTVRFTTSELGLLEFRPAAIAAFLRDPRDPSDIRIQSQLTSWIPHARHLADTDEMDHAMEARLRHWLGLYYTTHGDYLEAKRMYEIAIQIFTKVDGENGQSTQSTLCSLGAVLSRDGNLVGARQVLEGVLASVGEQDPLALTVMQNLATVLQQQKDYPAAQRLLERVLETSKRTKGETHPHTIGTMSSLAVALKHQGDLAGARMLHEAVLTAASVNLGENHPFTLDAMNNLAMTLLAQGDSAAARRLHERCYTIAKAMYGESNPEILIYMNNLAGTLFEQGKLAEAQQLFKKAVETSQRTLGAEHPQSTNLTRTLEVVDEALRTSEGT